MAPFRVPLFIAAAICLMAGPAAAEGYADAILGVWVVAEKDAHVEIYKQGDEYFGKIVWMRDAKEPPGPQTGMFETPRVGVVIARTFRFDGKAWKGGTLYDPSDGKSYRGILTLDDEGALHVRGFIGFALLGRTTVWHRVQGRPKSMLLLKENR